MTKDDLSGADIKVCFVLDIFFQCYASTHTSCALQAICTEAGLLALRERRMKVCQADFRKAKEIALYRKKGGFPESLYL
jgi:ATP-dependent 26S proteasome regulatory subunit